MCFKPPKNRRLKNKRWGTEERECQRSSRRSRSRSRSPLGGPFFYSDSPCCNFRLEHVKYSYCNLDSLDQWVLLLQPRHDEQSAPPATSTPLEGKQTELTVSLRENSKIRKEPWRNSSFQTNLESFYCKSVILIANSLPDETFVVHKRRQDGIRKLSLMQNKVK